MIRIGMAQILVECGAAESNLRRASAMIAEAASRRCDYVVLPECLDAGWTHPSAREIAQPVPGPTCAQLAAAARTHGVYVVAGITERAGDRIYNAAVLLSPDGELLLKHRKINELDIAHDLYSLGGMIGVAETGAIRTGVTICADNFPDSLDFARSIARMGARLLLSPCAWAVDADHDNQLEPYGDLWLGAYSELSRAFDITVVGVSNVGWMTGGPWQGRKCIGCSLAVGPGGKVLATGPYGVDAEALVPFDVP